MAKVLVVDDNEGVRMTIRFILEGAGHTVILTDNGKSALEKLEDADAIVTDMLMPEMAGAEFMMRVREKCDKIPILAISGGGNKINMEEALDIARTLADHVLRKPFTQGEFLEAFDFLLKKKQ